MKKLKFSLLVVLSLTAFIVIAQAVKQDVNSSLGNGKAMEYNLNEPNAVSPAMDNNQGYEKDGVILRANIHPEKNLSNSYNRSSYEAKK